MAVSGGPDSVALLLLAHAAFPGSVMAATVDHQLRAGSAAEAQTVADLCATIGVKHQILRLDGRSDFSAFANLQDRARAIRYDCLERWAAGWDNDLIGARRADWVATAHHRDDVAETFVMRAVRGAGVRGLAAMIDHRPIRPMAGISLIRPLLDWSRSELAKVVQAAGVGVVTDPSNSDPRYDRARVRKLLSMTPELPPARLAKAARNLRDAEDALEWLVLRDLKTRLTEDDHGDLLLEADDLPFELQRRFVIRAIEGIRQENDIHTVWDVTGADRLVRTLTAGKGGTLAGVQARVLTAGWHFRLAPPRRPHR
ncbi:MAG: tRNA lysidine(34) synthetase TilS [Pseudomonadota bacterium]